MHRVTSFWRSAFDHPGEAFAAAFGIAVLLFVAVVALSTTGQPRIVRADSIPAVAAWAALFNGLATALLAFGAVLAAVGLREQLNELRRGREASFRPHLTIRSGKTMSQFDWVIVGLRNVGAGAALDVRVQAWMVEEPPDWPETPDWLIVDHLSRQLEGLGAEVDLEGDTEVIAAGDEGSVWLKGRIGTNLMTGRPHWFLVARVEYEDVFTNDFAVGGHTSSLAWVSTSEAES